MRIFNSLIVPKNVKEGPLSFSNIHSGANYQMGDSLKTLKNFEIKSHKAIKGAGKVSAPKNWKGGYFWVLHFKVEAFGGVQNQLQSTFGKSESFT